MTKSVILHIMSEPIANACLTFSALSPRTTRAMPRNTQKTIICMRFPSAMEEMMLLGNISVRVSAMDGIASAS